MIFKLYDCDVGITYKGTNYDFEHVDQVTIEDPETTKLTRGANASNKLGLAYKEGIKEAKKITTVLKGVPMDLHNLLKAAYAAKDRMDFYVVSRADGSSKIAKNCILANEPKQLTLDDSVDSMNTSLGFESFDVSEVHKS